MLEKILLTFLHYDKKKKNIHIHIYKGKNKSMRRVVIIYIQLYEKIYVERGQSLR